MGVCGGEAKILALPYYSRHGHCVSWGTAEGQKFLLRLTTASAQCLHLFERFFILDVIWNAIVPSVL